MGPSSTVLHIQEYGDARPIAAELARLRSLSLEQAEHRIRLAGEAAQRLLGLKHNPIEFGTGGVRAIAIAGVLGLGLGVDLEIAPKYARIDDAHWRQDLFFLTLFTRHGELLLRNQVSALAGTPNDLSELAAQLLINLYTENRRTPLRTRRQTSFASFDYETDIDPEELVFPGEGGFAQVDYILSRDNRYAATISECAKTLYKKVRNAGLQGQLLRVVQELGVVGAQPSKTRMRLPPRLTRWQLLYDFAFDILQGYGLSPGPGAHRIPGFVVNTWQMWQGLVTRALQVAFGSAVEGVQMPYDLGFRRFEGASTVLETTPDCVVRIHSAPIVVDAKYKGRADREFGGISSADIYESLAFMDAVKTQRTLLVYPSARQTLGNVGEAQVVEEITSHGKTITAFAIEIDGVARPGGLLAFANGLRSAIETLVIGA